MSIEAMNWALSQRVGNPSGKSVLLILANRADQSGRCWPGIDGISEQTELGVRTVINQIKQLAEIGVMCIRRRGGDGGGRSSNMYFLHVAPKCNNCTLGQCASDDRQCASDDEQCAADAPEPKDNPKKNRQSRGRASRLPDDFELTTERRTVAEAEQVPPERTFAKFRDYWRAASGQKARKHDWDATWRNWCRSEADRSRSSGSAQRKTKFEEYYGAETN